MLWIEMAGKGPYIARAELDRAGKERAPQRGYITWYIACYEPTPEHAKKMFCGVLQAQSRGLGGDRRLLFLQRWA